MNYPLLKDVIHLLERFEHANERAVYSKDLNGFQRWIYEQQKEQLVLGEDPDWEGKENGRSAESVISTLFVHLNRYARSYSKSAIHGSVFSSQEDFIYLINLKAFGTMTKMELIKKNIQDKPTGMQIINRLIKHGWVRQTNSMRDKRSKLIEISEEGKACLEAQMHKIRQATAMVAGDLSYSEKMDLIRLLTRLNEFHHPIFREQMDPEELLRKMNAHYLMSNPH